MDKKSRSCRFSALALGLIALGGQGAQAQSSVAIYGTIDANIGSYKGAATGITGKNVRTWQQEAGGMTTSFFGIKGSEDLGGGLKAEFDLQSFHRNDTGSSGRSDAIPNVVAADPFFSKASWVGFQSASWGKLRLGNMITPLFLNSIGSNAFGDSTVFSPINLVTFVGSPLSGGTNWKDTVFYETPRMGGLTLSINHAFSEGANGANTGVRAAYASGAWSTSLVWTSVKRDPVTFSDGTTRNDTRNLQLAAAYDFQVVKLFAHLGQIQVLADSASATRKVTHDIWGLSASAPLGNGTLLAGMASRKGDEVIGASRRSVISLGYDYPLSRRTDLYAVLRNDRTRAAAALDVSGTSYAAGIRHRF